MKKSFITLAVLIALVPHLGFPQAWKNAFVTVSAALIIVLVVIPRKESNPREYNKKETSFTQNAPEIKKQEPGIHDESHR